MVSGIKKKKEDEVEVEVAIDPRGKEKDEGGIDLRGEETDEGGVDLRGIDKGVINLLRCGNTNEEDRCGEVEPSFRRGRKFEGNTRPLPTTPSKYLVKKTNNKEDEEGIQPRGKDEGGH